MSNDKAGQYQLTVVHRLQNPAREIWCLLSPRSTPDTKPVVSYYFEASWTPLPSNLNPVSFDSAKPEGVTPQSDPVTIGTNILILTGTYPFTSPVCSHLTYSVVSQSSTHDQNYFCPHPMTSRHRFWLSSLPLLDRNPSPSLSRSRHRLGMSGDRWRRHSAHSELPYRLPSLPTYRCLILQW